MVLPPFVEGDGPRQHHPRTPESSSKCPYCFIEGMENLVFTGWAVYTCTSGDAVTGKALLFNTAPFNARLGPLCG
ncbi:hypothetical protein HJC10_21300 [Corallococcus exiguus]|uniref:hypothetical protein n=1 Tax=Corallococcus TaxID=83461 RepID=UPI0011C3FE65|nr:MULTISPECIES: hypothetical protein [Corallococcus]NNC05378.1 hypothetical protein [Corallococcus exiguus]NPC50734.1 hypothetical protein [Corallococcus exiguus]